MISGDLSGGIVVSEGEVWINGQRVDSSRGAQVFPSTQREVVLSVPRADRPRYSLHTQAGSVEIKKTGGECTILTNAANVQIEKYTGNVSLENQSGNVQIESLKGNLFIHATSGGVNDFDGSLNLTAISGDVQLMRAILKGTSNNINVTSGNIRVSVANDSLLVSAQTSSGTITTPHGNEFVIVQEECPNTEGRSSRHGIIVIASANSIVSIGGSSRSRFVEGRFGQLEIPENKLFSHSTGGDITLVKS